MKIGRLFVICLVALGCIGIVACSEEEVVPEVKIVEGGANYFGESMSFSSAGGTKILAFTSNVPWTLALSASQSMVSWCEMSQTEGVEGRHEVRITVERNTRLEDRSVILVLTAGELKKYVFVNQKQQDMLTLTPTQFEMGRKGGTIDVEVKTNADYKVEIDEKCKDWISQKSGTRAIETSRLSFVIAENKEFDNIRVGEIRVFTEDVCETVKVYQRGR